MLNINKILGNKKNKKQSSVNSIQISKTFNNKNLNINFDNNSKNKINYRNESFPGFNIPKEYKGNGNYKYRVLAKDGNKISVINFADKRYEDFLQHKNPKRWRNFRDRHKCYSDSPKRLTARFWSCNYNW